MTTPTIGMGATQSAGSDSYPYTVIKVSASGKTIQLQEDKAIVTVPAKQYGDPVEYRYERDPAGGIIKATLRKDGYYRQAGCRNYGTVHLGSRRMYRDPHF